MVEVAYGPQWFFGFDGVIDVISIFVLLLIALSSFRYYRLNSQRNYLVLGTAFSLLALSLAGKLITDVLFHTKLTYSVQEGVLTVTRELLQPWYSIVVLSSIAYQGFLLFGSLLLFLIYNPLRPLHLGFIAFLLFIVLAFASPAFLVVNLVAFVLTLLIAISYMRRFKENKVKTTKLLALSFGVLAVSRLLFMLVVVHQIYYAIAEVLQLVAFLTILVTFISVIRHAKEKVAA